MLKILSRLVQEKQPSQMLKKFMFLTGVFSGSLVFDQFRGLFPFFQGSPAYSVKLSKCKQYKVHAYRNPRNSTTFVLEPSKEDPLKCCMTGFGVDIKTGDFIVIEDRNLSMAYKVENIDYYLDPPDLWMALLIECGDFPNDVR
jgi:hypothetical protein